MNILVLHVFLIMLADYRYLKHRFNTQTKITKNENNIRSQKQEGQIDEAWNICTYIYIQFVKKIFAQQKKNFKCDLHSLKSSNKIFTYFYFVFTHIL